MDDDLLAILLGGADAAEAFRDADEDGQLELLEDLYSHLEPARLLPRLIVLQQIEGAHPHVAATARRLLDAGLEPDEVMLQLTLVAAESMYAAVERGEEFDADAFDARLDRLPLPGFEEVAASFRRIAAEARVLPTEELASRVTEDVGLDPDEPNDLRLIEGAEELLVEPAGPLVWLERDRTASVEELARDMVLTHVITAAEVAEEVLDLSFDLAAFAWAVRDREDEDWSVCADARDHVHAHGPDGWLDDVGAGAVVAVRLGEDEPLRLEPLVEPPPSRPDLVAAVRAAYDREHAVSSLPVDGLSLLVATRLEESSAFTQPEAPLEHLAAAADLEVRAGHAAHDRRVWRAAARMDDVAEVIDRAEGDEGLADEAIAVLRTCDRLVDGEAVTDDDVEAALDGLADLDVLRLVEGPLLAEEDAGELVAALLDAARRKRHVAAVRYLAALLAEYDRDILAAEQHLELAHQAAPRFLPATDRLAWYASDRGDAARAVRLLRQGASGAGRADREVIEPLLVADRKMSRNEPCWCGSGRKYKRCHLGQAAQAPLPDRVRWLWRKAAGFVERADPEAVGEWFALLAAAAESDDPEAIREALADPLVMDLALVEAGLFEEFLGARSPLLPDDEALLAASWETVERTVYEVTGTAPGGAVTLRDLRTADVVEVRDGPLAGDAVPGVLLCGRAVPDGEGHQMVGAVVRVPPGQETDLLDLLDTGDPFAILAWFVQRRQLPALTTREGEPLVAVDMELEVEDPAALVAHLDAVYEAEQPGLWLEHHPLDADEFLLRARLELDGERLRVTTNSEERAERILARLDDAVGYRVVRDERHPVRSREDLAVLPTLAPVDDDTAPLPPEMIADLQDKYERQWCDEPVPALGGLTPRQAAADPIRREALERLLASFDVRRIPEGGFGMRADRLRTLLGL